jgi:rare lipoprotein A
MKKLFCILVFSATMLLSQQLPKNVLLTYYHNYYEGRMTASGEIFRQDSLTAAAPAFVPFGTVITVKNPKNGKVVKVKVNDRSGNPRNYNHLDLSYRAAKELDMIYEGRIYGEAVIAK